MRSRVRAIGTALFCLAIVAAAVPGSHRQAAASSSSVGVFTLGLGGWQVQSSAIAPQSGSVIATPLFDTTTWLKVKPDDAGAPGTEIEALLQNGACPNVFFSANILNCFGYSGHVGPVVVPQFAVPWWFRTDFGSSLQAGQDASLVINGVVGQADVWVNGHEVATQATVQGAFTRYTFDVTNLIGVTNSMNTLALEVYPNDPTSMYTLDDVDWNQIPPDNNTGIQFPILLHVSNALGLDNAHVLQSTAADLSQSMLTVKADVTNHDSISSQSGIVTATITPPDSTTPALQLSQAVTLQPGQTKPVSFAPATIKSPQIWWPYRMGNQPLYSLTVTLSQGTLPAETEAETFGIRNVDTCVTADPGCLPGAGTSPMAPNGVRVFKVNGQPFILRGGGFAENLFLHYSAKDTANQIELIRSMGVNAIRTEGKQLPEDFYAQMDRAGIMIDGGFQCCDFWQFTNSLSQHDLNVIALSALSIGQNLRNHPSVINFSWSDNNPSLQQEQAELPAFAQADFQDPLIASAEYKTDPLGVLGPSGEKEGPYDWVPPSYWYDTTHFDPSNRSLTNEGGSWAFDSEESAGDTVPTMDSIHRFLGSNEQSDLWQNPGAKQYHTNYESGAQTGYHFGTLHNIDAAISNRYGQWSSLDQYVKEAQVQNYEDTRAQFEAFIDHWTNRPVPSTGTVYWQMNKGWPTLLWDLYNNDYDEAGSYFGAKKANEALHVLYAVDTGSVTADNLGGASQSSLSVVAKVYDVNGRLLDQQGASGLSLPGQGVKNAVITPKVPATTVPPTPAKTYFVELTLSQNNAVVGRNVYWLSTQQDIVDFGKSLGQPQSTIAQYGDLAGLQSLAQLPASALSVTASGRSGTTTVTITNPSTANTVAFFLRADVRRGNPDGSEQAGDNQVLPISWSDNDITLFPGESQTLTASYDPLLLQGATPVVSIRGWNVTRFDRAAG